MCFRNKPKSPYTKTEVFKKKYSVNQYGNRQVLIKSLFFSLSLGLFVVKAKFNKNFNN